MTKQEKIYNLVGKIPEGKVITYGAIAKIVGTSPRAVGKILHNNKNPNGVPCHRVVFGDGSLSSSYAFGGIKKQKEKLTNEGLKFLNNRVIK